MEKKNSLTFKQLSIRLLLLILVVVVLFLLYKFVMGEVKTTSTRNKPTETADKQSASDVPQMAPNELYIRSLGIRAPIVYPEENSEEEFQRVLGYGVVQFPGTAKPGAPGNTYIFGHSSDLPWSKGKYKTIFEKLPDIQNGAIVDISDASGKIFSYAVKDQFVVEKTDTHVLEQDKTKTILTLQTSYPIGTADKRYIVISELVKN